MYNNIICMDAGENSSISCMNTNSPPETGIKIVHPIHPHPRDKHHRATGEYAGIKSWIELEQNGQFTRVSPSFSFHNGDHFRIGVETRQDGYLTIFNKGTTGAVRTLYPRGNANGYIKASVPYLSGRMTFDNNPGEEVVGLWLCNKPCSENNASASASAESTKISEAINEPAQPAISLSACETSKDVFLADDCQETSKDIFSEDDQNGGLGLHPAAYDVMPMTNYKAGKIFTKKLQLKHEGSSI